MSKIIKGRLWATIIYPESVNKDYEDILRSSFVETYISPLHDCDFDLNGEIKKAHRHILLCFDGPVTVDQAKKLIDSFGGVGAEKVMSKNGYIRYLCHLDNPEKTLYSTDDIVCLNGADYTDYINKRNIDRYNIINDMCGFCVDNGITEFEDLLNYSRLNNRDWFIMLCDSCTYIMERFLNSRRNRNRRVDIYK